LYRRLLSHYVNGVVFHIKIFCFSFFAFSFTAYVAYDFITQINRPTSQLTKDQDYNDFDRRQCVERDTKCHVSLRRVTSFIGVVSGLNYTTPKTHSPRQVDVSPTPVRI